MELIAEKRKEPLTSLCEKIHQKISRKFLLEKSGDFFLQELVILALHPVLSTCP
jgi:hypothetical protein